MARRITAPEAVPDSTEAFAVTEGEVPANYQDHAVSNLSCPNFFFNLFCFSLDNCDGGNYAKLFVGAVPRTATEDDVSVGVVYFPNLFQVYIFNFKVSV